MSTAECLLSICRVCARGIHNSKTLRACCRQRSRKQGRRCFRFQLLVRRKLVLSYGAALMGSGRFSAGDLSCGQGSPSCWRRLLLLFWACGRSGRLLFISAIIHRGFRSYAALSPGGFQDFTLSRMTAQLRVMGCRCRLAQWRGGPQKSCAGRSASGSTWRAACRTQRSAALRLQGPHHQQQPRQVTLCHKDLQRTSDFSAWMMSTS